LFFSDKKKILFIAAPKTGSTSVEDILTSRIQDGQRFKIALGERLITSKDVRSPSLGHAKAKEFRDVLGDKHYDDLTVFGFVRDPIEKVVSSYFFTRSGSIRQAFSIKSEKARAPQIMKRILAICSARVLPLSLWSLVYRMRSCADYFMDEDGMIIVDILGATHRLGSDLVEIMRNVEVDFSPDDVPHTNRSKHRYPNEYILFRFCIPLLERRYKEDSQLFEKVRYRVWKNPDRKQPAW